MLSIPALLQAAACLGPAVAELGCSLVPVCLCGVFMPQMRELLLRRGVTSPLEPRAHHECNEQGCWSKLSG